MALTQAQLVATQLHRFGSPALKIETIATIGDQQADIPLWQLEGQNFFTRELDTALLKKKVHLVVHSYKDLGINRPKGIKQAAVTKRTYPHDVLLIKKSKVLQLREQKCSHFCVGTSSLRRIYHIENSLQNFFPSGDKVTITTAPLRGNITTRIEKLQKDEYQGIVLALAGLERLASSPESIDQLAFLLKGLDYMVLPISSFPSAAAQGALNIETSEDGPLDLFRYSEKLNHEDTLEEVARERKILKDYGGGCHLAIGISVKKIGSFFLDTKKGEIEGEHIDIRTLKGKRPPCAGPLFVGLPSSKSFPNKKDVLWDELIEKNPFNVSMKEKLDVLSVTSSYCLDAVAKVPANVLIAAGPATHRRLAKEGYWVHLNMDGLGEQEANLLLESKALKIMQSVSSHGILTGEYSTTSTSAKIIPCYKREICLPEESFKKRIDKTQTFYWTSFFQYQIYLEHFPSIKDKQHACGLGKTFEAFQKSNLPVIPFADIKEFFCWSKTKG